jgi:hypothetical protein
VGLGIMSSSSGQSAESTLFLKLKQLSDLSVRQKRFYDYIFSEFTEQGMQALLTKVFALKNRMEKASAISSTGLDD